MSTTDSAEPEAPSTSRSRTSDSSGSHRLSRGSCADPRSARWSARS